MLKNLTRLRKWLPHLCYVRGNRKAVLEVDVTEASKKRIEVSGDAAVRVRTARDWVRAYPADKELLVIAQTRGRRGRSFIWGWLVRGGRGLGVGG